MDHLLFMFDAIDPLKNKNGNKWAAISRQRIVVVIDQSVWMDRNNLYSGKAPNPIDEVSTVDL